MKKYSDYQKNKIRSFLTEEEMKKVEWTKFKIVVPTEEDKQEIMDAFHHFHNSNIDTEFVTVNQLAHQYLDDDGMNIVVNKELYDELNK